MTFIVNYSTIVPPLIDDASLKAATGPLGRLSVVYFYHSTIQLCLSTSFFAYSFSVLTDCFSYYSEF